MSSHQYSQEYASHRVATGQLRHYIMYRVGKVMPIKQAKSRALARNDLFREPEGYRLPTRSYCQKLQITGT
jgi:hypothetical protein